MPLSACRTKFYTKFSLKFGHKTKTWKSTTEQTPTCTPFDRHSVKLNPIAVFESHS